MNPRMMLLVPLLAACPLAVAQDPVATDGDKYRVLLENTCVRVLEYRDRPGAKTRPHAHPAFVLYALTPFTRALSLADGSTSRREFDSGDVLYSPAQMHAGENVGTTPTHALLVEMKTGAGACPPKPQIFRAGKPQP